MLHRDNGSRSDSTREMGSARQSPSKNPIIMSPDEHTDHAFVPSAWSFSVRGPYMLRLMRVLLTRTVNLMLQGWPVDFIWTSVTKTKLLDARELPAIASLPF